MEGVYATIQNGKRGNLSHQTPRPICYLTWRCLIYAFQLFYSGPTHSIYAPQRFCQGLALMCQKGMAYRQSENRRERLGQGNVMAFHAIRILHRFRFFYHWTSRTFAARTFINCSMHFAARLLLLNRVNGLAGNKPEAAKTLNVHLVKKVLYSPFARRSTS